MANGRLGWIDNMTKINLKNILICVRDIINRSVKPGMEKAKSAEQRAQEGANLAAKAQSTAEAAQSTAEKCRAGISSMLSKTVSFVFDKQTTGRDSFVCNGFNYYKINEFCPNNAEVISFQGTRESGSSLSDFSKGVNCYCYGFFIVVTEAGPCALYFKTDPSGDWSFSKSFNAPSTGLYARYEVGNPAQTAGHGEFTCAWTCSDDGASWKTVLANCDYVKVSDQTVQKIESLDKTNKVSIRSLDSGSYVLYGYFVPYEGATSTMTFSDNILVNVLKGNTESHVQIFYPYNNCVQYLKITDTTYDRKNIYLNDLVSSGDDVIIGSSTEGSTKKFKITVDDAGTISAIEVTA